ncbi:ABC transporter permease [Paraburkholderia dinghuensis]|uniref:Histidine ABC transporter permease HisQ n=1 Tax=Paraburkholderia dinghuensis TaxID=2305225 RepID=A0A3N6MXH4_9BURK|nr:histidine ABC transporter permease HisQ [Paraburkholderia dinghuensis]RQH08469.1 histidine ABC transporter permease HisQ [Paraburkholderia dinghuensis]
MFLQGYGPLILAGTWQTVKLSVLSLVLSFVLGLIGAAAKLSKNRVAYGAGTVYTTLIRGVPDLVLMLLLFYSLQIWLNNLTEAVGWDQIDIDPFVAGVIVLGFIYGAYFTETFRGAFIAVPRGQLEAGHAYGMTSWQVFRRIMFPQMMRFALPGIGNNWQVLVKSTALVSIIGLADVVKASQDAGKGTLRFFFFTLVAGAIYLVVTTVSNFVLMYLEKRYSTGVRKADL